VIVSQSTGCLLANSIVLGVAWYRVADRPRIKALLLDAAELENAGIHVSGLFEDPLSLLRRDWYMENVQTELVW
jgi:hypothetical protein